MTNAELIRRRVDAAGIAADRRSAILTLLDDTASLLSEPLNWSVRQTVSQRIEEARSEALRAARDAMLGEVEAARAQEEKEDSIASVQVIIDEGAKLKRNDEGKADPEEKKALLRRIVVAWRARLASLPDPNPPALR